MAEKQEKGAFDFSAFAAAVLSQPPPFPTPPPSSSSSSSSFPSPPPGFASAALSTQNTLMCSERRQEKALLASDGSAGYGGGEFAEEILNRNSAPKDKKFKWNYLWGQLPEHLMCRIEMDEVASFSVTDMTTADHISRELINLPGISRQSTITDGTACVGGNSISFARYFDTVYAIELDDARLGMLKNNLATCLVSQSQESNAASVDGLEDKKLQPIVGQVVPLHGDCLQLCPQLRQDILFLDPPWGGKTYNRRDQVDLFLSNKSLADVCQELGKYTRYIALKLPYNANVDRMLQDPTCRRVKDVDLNKKMKMTVLEYRACISQDQLNFLRNLGLKVPGDHQKQQAQT